MRLWLCPKVIFPKKIINHFMAQRIRTTKICNKFYEIKDDIDIQASKIIFPQLHFSIFLGVVALKYLKYILDILYISMHTHIYMYIYECVIMEFKLVINRRDMRMTAHEKGIFHQRLSGIEENNPEIESNIL